MQRLLKMFRVVAWWALLVFVRISVLLFFIWSAGAIYYLHYLPFFVRVVLVVAYVSGSVWLVCRGWWKRREAATTDWIAFNRAVAFVAATIPFVYLLTLGVRATNDRAWAADQDQLPLIKLVDDDVTIMNFRNAVYRSETDFDVVYETRNFKLSEVTEVWFIVQRFTAMEGLAHTFLSFGVQPDDGGDKHYFSVSVEIRREVGEGYSPWKGLFRNYEINYVVGDERDMIGVRTVHRPDDRVYLFRTNATPAQAQTMFRNIVSKANDLRERPEFYNTLLNNCTNSIVAHSRNITFEPINWLDLRVILPGYSHEVIFEMGIIGNCEKETLEECCSRFRVDQRAREVGIVEGFSARIREGIDQ